MLAMPLIGLSQGVRTDYCSDYTHTATLGHDALGCYIDIEVCYKWTPGGNVLQYPYGVEALLPPQNVAGTYASVAYPAVPNQGGASITSTVPIPGWLTTGPTVMSSLGSTILGYSYSSNRDVRFSRNTGIATDAIPSCPTGAPQKFRIRIITTGTSDPIVLRVNLLNGNGCPTCNVMCTWDTTFVNAVHNYQLTGGTICTGTSTVLTLTPAPPAGSTATIYWADVSNCSSSCPTTWPCPGGSPLGISFVCTGSPLSFPTNPLFVGRCYKVVISDGCFSNTATSHVCVCPPCSSITIGATVTGPNPPLVDGHVCDHFTGTISLGIDPNACPVGPIIWDKTDDGVGTSLASHATTIPAFTLLGPGPLKCNRTYIFTATFPSPCEPGIMCTKSITNIVDRKLLPNEINITSDKPIPLCDSTGTILRATAPCKAKITNWYQSPTGSPGTFTQIGGAFGPTYMTNNLNNPPLINCIWYQCDAVNGACTTTSAPFQVTVKCPLTISIVASSRCVPTTLTAIVPPCCGTPMIITWYRGNIPVTVQVGTGTSINVTTPGIYCAEVKDPACHNSAISNFITLCHPVVTVQNACICKRPPNVPFILDVNLSGCCPGCTFNYTWVETGLGTFNGSGTGLVCGANAITIPTGQLPPILPAGTVLHFTFSITSTCGAPCSVFSNTNSVTVCH